MKVTSLILLHYDKYIKRNMKIIDYRISRQRELEPTETKGTDLLERSTKTETKETGNGL